MVNTSHDTQSSLAVTPMAQLPRRSVPGTGAEADANTGTTRLGVNPAGLDGDPQVPRPAPDTLGYDASSGGHGARPRTEAGELDTPQTQTVDSSHSTPPPSSRATRWTARLAETRRRVQRMPPLPLADLTIGDWTAMVLDTPGDFNPFCLGLVTATFPRVVVQAMAYTDRGPLPVWFKGHMEMHKPTSPRGYLPWELGPIGPGHWGYVQGATASRAKEVLAAWFQENTGLRTLS